MEQNNQQNITNDVTNHSVEFVQNQIKLKNHHQPYVASNKLIKNSITDMDVFPYTRFYRGEPTSSNPTVMEREAGFRIRHDEKYKSQTAPPEKTTQNICFQPPCSTIFPCIGKTNEQKAIAKRNNEINSMISNNLTM